MRKSRFSDEQMVAILREADRTSVAEAAKKHKVSDQTIYAWTLQSTLHSIGEAIDGSRRGPPFFARSSTSDPGEFLAQRRTIGGTGEQSSKNGAPARP